MNARRLFALLVTIALALCEAKGFAAPLPTDAADALDSSAKAARDEGKYVFCKQPRPLGPRQLLLCETARGIEGCEGFVAACDKAQKTKEPTSSGWFVDLLSSLGPLFKVLVYILFLVILVVVAVPVVRGILRARRDKKLADPDKPLENRAIAIDRRVIVPDEITDADSALRLAEEHRARGELDRALGLYLAASLAALDRRGALRVARHRTNGEYIRGCNDPTARESLREIVREVDRVEFGGAHAESGGVERVATRATSIVRAVAIVTLAFGLLGCGGRSGAPGADPAGNEVPRDVLTRNGFAVARLETSLATVAMPEQGKPAPIIAVDLESVHLEPESEAHLLRWVEAGGVLVLFGDPGRWPKDLDVKKAYATTHELAVRLASPESEVRFEPEDDEAVSSPDEDSVSVEGAHVTRMDAIDWTGSEGIAFLGKDVYAAKKRVGKGAVVAVANGELFTNVGIMPRRNAAAFVTLARIAAAEQAVALDAEDAPITLRYAGPEDGVPPPSNPFAALVAAGLGRGLWHALAATILLFLCYGIRRARPRPLPAEARRAFAEHVEATGAFYGRARALPHALSAYGKFVEMRLREKIPRGADPAAFLAARSGVPKEQAEKVYARALSAKGDDPIRGDELGTIKELRAMLAKAFA